jgi:GPH family glycoside/pentoside/hexuronide:cation symporter
MLQRALQTRRQLQGENAMVAQTGTPDAQRRLPLGNVLAFATTSMPMSALVISVGVFLPQYYATYFGISLIAVGGIFSIVRMLDLGVDFVLGMGMDRTRTPLGRYRPWLILGAPVLMGAVYMLFLTHLTGQASLIAWLLVMYLGTSIISLAHTAWASTLARAYDERSRLFAAMTAVGVIGSVMVLLTPPILARFGHMTGGADVHAVGWMIIALTPITVALVVLRTPERVTPQASGVHFQWSDYWGLIARPTMLRILVVDFCLGMGPGWMAALYFWFFQQSLEFSRASASLLLLIYIAAGLVGAPLMGRLAVRISKHRATMVATTAYSLILIAVVLIPHGNFVAAILPMFAAGFTAAGFNVLTRAMTADIADEVRLEQGKERTALVFALTTLTTKLAGALAISASFFALSEVGFVAREGARNSAAAIHGLNLVYIIGPIFFVMAAGLALIGYRLNAARHCEIRQALEARDALYDEAPVVETLSGPGSVAAE